MFSFMRSSNVLQQATKSWRLLFTETFCCHMKPDTLLSPKRNLSYATFKARNEEPETSDDALSSYGDLDESVNEELSRPSTLNCPPSDEHDVIKENQDKVIVSQPVTPLPTSCEMEKSPAEPPVSPKISSSRLDVSMLSSDSLKEKLSPASECSSSGVSSGILTQPSSMEFSDAALVHDKLEEVEEVIEEETSECAPADDEFGTKLQNPYATQEASVADVPVEVDVNPISAGEPNPVTTTNDELLTAIDKCGSATDILEAVTRHTGPVSPLLGVACIHYIYMKALSQYERNSPSYNNLCGIILTNPTFKDMVYSIEANAKSLNNFALLTVASDLLYLRITLKKSTIPTLLACIDCESLNLDELRLLASCLHTPNFPLINSEYMYNVAGGVAMKHLDDITDLYTLLSIIKCFGRYFTTNAKRHADTRVASFVGELSGTYPDGRLMASHMFDAFYRMEYAPSRPLQLEACKAINSSVVPLLPQDVSAILRYFVKYGYNLTNDGLIMLSKISDVLYRHLEHEPVSKFTTNVKWLSVFYYYNEPLLERFVDAVKRDMDKLDFVALSDVLDTLAQVSGHGLLSSAKCRLIFRRSSQ